MTERQSGNGVKVVKGWLRTKEREETSIIIETKDGFTLSGAILPWLTLLIITQFATPLEASNLTWDAPVRTDKGCGNMSNRAIIQERRFIDGIIQRVVRKKPLTFL